MSFVVVSPEAVAAASRQFAAIGTALHAANAAAAAGISEVAAAGHDEVSRAIAAVFSEHADTYQVIRRHAEGFHVQFVQVTADAGRQYQAAESHFFAILAARQASRASQPSHLPHHDTNPGG